MKYPDRIHRARDLGGKLLPLGNATQLQGGCMGECCRVQEHSNFWHADAIFESLLFVEAL